MNKTVPEKIKELKSACQKKGMRLTKQRIEIYKEIAYSCEHPDAETIYELVKHKIPNVSIDTIYRTLSSLEELDMIFRVDSQLSKARFDADKTPHNHFICTKCHEVYDVFLEPSEMIKIPKSAYEYGNVRDINIQIRGICKNCLKKQ